MDKQIYKEEWKELSARLAALQLVIKEKGIPVIIAMDGWSAAGKGTLIAKLVYELDPRYFKVHAMSKVNEDARLRPHLWPFWLNTPSKGRIALFDRSWIRPMLPGTKRHWDLRENERESFYDDVNAFEKQLTDDGTLIIKFFLQISKDEQRKRFKDLEKNPATKWRVDDMDWEQNRQYEENLPLYEEVLGNNSQTGLEWTVLESDDKRYATIKALRVIIEKIEGAIKKKDEQAKGTREVSVTAGIPSILSRVDLSKKISQDDYKDKIDSLQDKLSDLCFEMYSKRRAVALVYEGWDAAGKGGNIQRLRQDIDPRGYEVVPTSAPTADELAHHYLWRFYNHLPKDGHMAIFDRSWYGRVMVERVEGFASGEEWRRAYEEINEMERHWFNHGIILLKFWVHIDKDEQLARFHARQEDPSKQYKITDEDWRNREKWDLYEDAVNEMLFRTDTVYAPWKIIESNDKKYARVKTLEYVVNEMEKHLR